MIIKVFKQTGWQIIGKIITALSTIISLGIITRSYGQEGTGIYTLVLTYLAFFYLAADLGLNSYVLPYLRTDKRQANLLFNSRFYLAIALVITADLLSLILPFGNKEFIIAIFIGSLSIINAGIFNSANLIFQQHLKYDKSIIASSIGSFVSVLVIAYLSYLKAHAYYLMLAPLLGLITNNLVLFFIIKSYYKFKLDPPNFSFLLKTLKVAWPISLTLILNIVYFKVDSFILASVRSFAEVGIYNLAYAVFQNVLVIPTFIMNAFYPILLKNLNEDRKKFITQIKLGTLVMFVLGMGGAVASWLLTPLIINLLSEEGFGASITALRILSLSMPAFFVSSFLMWVALSLRQFKEMLVVYGIGLGVNTLLNIMLIPKYGYIAASWVTVISEYLILILLIIILYQQIGNKLVSNK